MEESESQLQENFIDLLKNNGYEYVEISNKDELIANFEKQLRLFNRVDFNFEEVLNYLNLGDKNDKFDKLRGSYNGVKFIDFSDFSSNIFQVAEEISITGDYSNRYDVTILINGLPLVQIELKKSGVNLLSAFGQIQRYSKHSFSGLFDLTQIFVISNNVNTKYFFNGPELNYSFAYNWYDNKNLEDFANSFLIKNNLMLILSGYIFKDLVSNNYMMLRQYQIDALTGVLEKIRSNENGYVWLTSNTGNTTTALRLAQILSANQKVIYVTRDNFINLDVSATKKDFLAKVNEQNLIFTHINILLALKEDEISPIKDRDFIFIIDDYDKHSLRYSPFRLLKLFRNSLFYCFTQSPIFDENIERDISTKTIFNSQIYNYSFKDALRDNTNLPINVEYVNDSEITEEYNLSSSNRVGEISKYIVDNFDKKSILMVSSNNDLIKYYEALKESNLKVVPVLRYESNDVFESVPIRDYFEKYVNEYNDNFNADIIHKRVVGTKKISKAFENDVISRFNDDEIDLVLIDRDMFFNQYQSDILGNFKNPQLDRIYLDCDLKYNDLLEVLTAVNMLDDNKSHGNVVIFRDLRENIAQAINLFSDNFASEEITFKNYDYYLDKYYHSFDDFKRLSYYYDILTTFDEFDFDDSQKNEFNTLKDEFEQKEFESNSNKKIIMDFTPLLIDKFTIDLSYEGHDESSVKKTTINIDNSKQTANVNVNNKINETNNVLNVKNEDNSEILNFLSLNRIDNSKELTVINQDLSKTVNITNEYHIHLADDKMPNEIDFDFDDLIESRTVNEDERLKFCIECQVEHPGDFKICPNHDEETMDLVYVDELIKFCKDCGRKYPKDFKYCPYCDCDEPLSIHVKEIDTFPNKYYDSNNHLNNFTEISQLLSNENIEKLNAFNFTQPQFYNIISKIKNTYLTILNHLIDEYGIELSSLSALDKILLFAKTFVKTDYKEGGGDLGYYQYNEIYIDDRLPNALQITTIIHELSHFLMAEIFEQVVCELLDTNKTDAVEAFVCYILSNNDLNPLVDEYCAHTVDGRFAPYGYQNYGSYEKCLDGFLQSFPEDAVEPANRIGNTFANHIKSIMETFIDENIRDDIKKEFSRMNDSPNYSGLRYETSELYDWHKFNTSIKLMLTTDLKDLSDNSQDLNKINEYAVKFKKNNQR